jgi:DNA replication and repair protein RecF
LRVSLERKPSGQVLRSAQINGKAYQSGIQYLTQRFGNWELGFHSIAFNPSDHQLIRGEPSGRRVYLNQVVSAESDQYLKILKRYQRVLDQRNALLKQPIHDLRLLMQFTDQLAPLAAEIAWHRLNWIQRIQSTLTSTAARIAPQQPRITLEYLSSWCVSEADELKQSTLQKRSILLENLENQFRKKAEQLRSQELRLRSTLAGPHRDDWQLLLGDQALKGHGSQGEIRTALLALKLSEIEIFKAETGHRPVLLLDDFSSELDRERRIFLLEHLKESDLQVFVTTTENAGYEGEVFQISLGNVHPLNRGLNGIRDHSTKHPYPFTENAGGGFNVGF